ncbi:MAG: efflux RND transporter periplasmic adaptor subunit [Maritimibacter sp.]|nr:efflux RND transporter periplasmic adaptor subunit [Maritimibacter sp.]
MRIKFHTVAAIVVLAAAGFWVATGEFTSVGSQIGGASPAEAAEASAPAGDVAAAEPAAEAAPAQQSVAFAVAEPAPYERWIRLSGQTEADKQVVLVARTSGTITELPVAAGDVLEGGALVMAVEGPEKLAAVESAKAQLATAANQAEVNQKLRARGALSELQLEASVAAREAARSGLEAAQAQADQLEVRAPFAGIVDEVFTDPGSWVTPGAQVASLLALDPIVVVGEVNERDLQSVVSGTKALVTFGDGTEAEGIVRYVRREASGVTRTFPIEVAIANPDAAIPAGMSAEIKLAIETDPAIFLPRSAITLDVSGALGVRVLSDDNVVSFLTVTIVDDTSRGLAIAGIEPGTRIIVSGQDMVSDGQTVDAVPADDVAAGTAAAPAAEGAN